MVIILGRPPAQTASLGRRLSIGTQNTACWRSAMLAADRTLALLGRNGSRLSSLLDVQIGGVELSGLLQSVPIFDDDAPALRRADETVSPELLQRPVYMDCREAGGIGELGLRDRQLVSLP